MKYEAFWIGSSIGSAAEKGLLLSVPYVLVTSIDSETELGTGSIKERFLSCDDKCEALGSGLITTGRGFSLCASTHGICTGFDEIWCFRERPRRAKSANLGIVAPFNASDDGVPVELIQWMTGANCFLGMGDGIGLNVIGFDRTLNSQLKRPFA